MAKNDGGRAFPARVMVREYDAMVPVYHGGMSLRDWFAGQAMTALCAWAATGGAMTANDIAEEAYKYADAMIAERAPE